jgi:uracil-DNA glycosylase
MKTITSYFAPKNVSREAPKSAEGNVEQKRLRGETSAPEPRKKMKRSEEVEALLAPLCEAEDPTLVVISWQKSLNRTFDSASFRQLAQFVANERVGKTIYPPAQDTFAALTLTPLERVRVVIVGQDPYHGPGQAHGLCFSVLPGQAIPPSLKNIYKELREDPDVDFSATPSHGHLSRWAKQGVLLLNTVMTVQKGNANSHKKKGWEEVTDSIIRAVDRRGNDGVVFLLWGKPATAKAQNLIGSASKHTVICTSHPSPLGARKTNSPFLGSRCFSRCNEALCKKGYKPIDWNVDGPLN